MREPDIPCRRKGVQYRLTGRDGASASREEKWLVVVDQKVCTAVHLLLVGERGYRLFRKTFNALYYREQGVFGPLSGTLELIIGKSIPATEKRSQEF